MEVDGNKEDKKIKGKRAVFVSTPIVNVPNISRTKECESSKRFKPAVEQRQKKKRKCHGCGKTGQSQ